MRNPRTPISRFFRNWSSTAFLVALLEWSSRQKSPIPSASNRFWTTSNAAIFSATKSTVFPFVNALAIIAVMVCDFPVPGGPCKTKLTLFAAMLIALSWDASTVIGKYASSVSTLSGILQSQSTAPLIRLLTISFLSSISLWLWISFHITNCENEKFPIKPASNTSHIGRLMIPCLIIAKILGKSNPWSSVGRGLNPLIWIS